MQPDPNLDAARRDATRRGTSQRGTPQRGTSQRSVPQQGTRRGARASSAVPKSPAVSSASAKSLAATSNASTRRAGSGAKHRQRQATKSLTNILLLSMFVPGSLLLAAMLYLVHGEYRWMQAQVDNKQAQLTAFEKQYEIGQHRLAALKSDKGNEEILIEHGYIPPGDRILLFPATGDEQRDAAIPKNDLAPHEPLSAAAPPGVSASSAWRGAGNLLHGWWQSLRVGAGVKPTTTGATGQPAADNKTGANQAQDADASTGASETGETSGVTRTPATPSDTAPDTSAAENAATHGQATNNTNSALTNDNASTDANSSAANPPTSTNGTHHKRNRSPGAHNRQPALSVETGSDTIN